MFVNDPHFQAGFIAIQQGEPMTACPLLFQGKPRKMWLNGYRYGELEKAVDDETQPLERVEKTPYEQGLLAYSHAVSLDDCPYGHGDYHGTPEEQTTYQAYHDWRLGWSDGKYGVTYKSIDDVDLPPKHFDCSKRCSSEPSIESQQITMLTADNRRMREAGCKLAEAALHTIREYDGLHRLALAVAAWANAVAGEGGRDARHRDIDERAPV